MILNKPVRVEKIAIALQDLPPHLSDTKIVQLSDLHYDGIHLSTETLQRAIAFSNEIEPDLNFITGDFVTDNPTFIEELASHL